MISCPTSDQDVAGVAVVVRDQVVEHRHPPIGLSQAGPVGFCRPFP
jgi:hypothetical protein